MTTVDAYLERIGAERPDVLDLDALARLQHAHLVAVPFENLDVFHRVPVSVDQDVVLAKIVGGRGGWCFENNGAPRGCSSSSASGSCGSGQLCWPTDRTR